MMGLFGKNDAVKDADFMSQLDAATRMRPATSASVMFFAIIAFVAIGFIWASVSEVEEITRGQGQVVPSKDIQVVQSLEGGVLQELLVREGESVEKDQILLRISDVQFSSEERGTEARFLELKAKRARLQAEANSEDFIVPEEVTQKAPAIASNEMALYTSRQKELTNAYSILDDQISKASAGIAETNAEINRMIQSRKPLQEELTLTKRMVAQRAVPKLEQLRLERELADINGSINALSQKKKGLQAELDVARKERSSQDDKFRSQALGELNSVETEISSLKENLKSIGDRVYRAEVRSPVKGVVNNLAVTTIGGVVEPAQKLVEIVPLDDDLKIVARVAPDQIAFLRPGQDVKVKITAYDPQKYGALDGTLSRIGSNSFTDSDGNVTFEIEVVTDKNYMGSEQNPLPITPGMVAQTEVITGKRTILEYMLKPVLRARDRAFTER